MKERAAASPLISPTSAFPQQSTEITTPGFPRSARVPPGKDGPHSQCKLQAGFQEPHPELFNSYHSPSAPPTALNSEFLSGRAKDLAVSFLRQHVCCPPRPGAQAIRWRWPPANHPCSPSSPLGEDSRQRPGLTRSPGSTQTRGDCSSLS